MTRSEHEDRAKPFSTLTDWCLIAMLGASLFFLGCRYDWGIVAWGEFALVVLASIATGSWLVSLWRNPKHGIRFGWPFVILALGGCLGLVQLIPLPESLHSWLSPGVSRHLPLGRDGALSDWRPSTLAPTRTADALRYYALYVLVFFLLTQTVRSVEQVEQWITRLFVVCAVAAGLALVQWLSWNGKFLWFIELPWVGTANVVRGPLTNKNHLAALLAMTAPAGLWFLLRSMGATRRSENASRQNLHVPLAALGLTITIVAALLTLSRGGILALALAITLSSAGLGWLIQAHRHWLAAMLVCATGIGGVLFVVGTERIEQRLATLAPDRIAHEAASSSRVDLWISLLRAIPDFPLLGSGIRSHENVYRLFLDQQYPFTFSHAENSYLQLLVEGGIPCVLLVFAGLVALAVACGRAIFRAHDSRVAEGGVVIGAGLLAAAAHAAVDFTWYIPSLALAIVMLAGMALRLSDLSSAVRSTSTPRWVTAPFAAAAAMLFAGWIPLAYSNAGGAMLFAQYEREFVFRKPAGQVDRNRAISLLSSSLFHRPNDPEIHFALADQRLGRFLETRAVQDVGMPLFQVRQTVADSSFSSDQAAETWLKSLFGSAALHDLKQAAEHYRRTVILNPLHASAYLGLAETSFVLGPSAIGPHALVQQALAARPFDPQIAYRAGMDLFAQQKPVEAMLAWKQAVRFDESTEQTVLGLLVPSAALTDILDVFDPGFASTIWLLHNHFTEADRSDDRLLVLKHAKAKAAETTNRKLSGDRFAYLCRYFTEAGAIDDAEDCARRAAAANPNEFEPRLALARLLAARSDWAAAREHIDWCYHRDPEHAEVRRLRLDVLKSKFNRRELQQTSSN